MAEPATDNTPTGATTGAGEPVPGIVIPPLIRPDKDLRQRLSAAINGVLKRLQDAGALPAGTTLTHLVDNPAYMHAFIRRYRENPASGDGIVVDRAGNPVADDATPLVCGCTLAQVERYLVVVCARQAFGRRQTEEGAGRLPAELEPYLAFAWQLPLIDAFARMNRYQLGELGAGVLCITTRAQADAIAGAPAPDIRKARTLTGERYMEMMQANPVAIRGLAKADEKTYAFFARATGERVWRFFGGDQQVVVETLALERKRAAAIAPFAADFCHATYRLIEDMPTPMVRPFLSSFERVFGANGRRLLADPRFADDFLAGVVGAFRGLEAESNAELEKVSEAAAMKWRLVKPDLIEWVRANRQAA